MKIIKIFSNCDRRMMPLVRRVTYKFVYLKVFCYSLSQNDRTNNYLVLFFT
ncbi:hypothetical protein M153_14500002371 [Pseudoloma neurophilia]|uniref:Uncharacterized protein n=1 Tax=Pseudoloma neurophilia TaxID=146866 RepID=A0A0R0LUR9_9MICR|nr:hypothetical protein M153_14500002371 [Pseudoloma neurophilia]